MFHDIGQTAQDKAHEAVACRNRSSLQQITDKTSESDIADQDTNQHWDEQKHVFPPTSRAAEKVAESVYKVIVDTGYDSDRAAADPRNDVGHADRNSFKNI